MVRRAVILVSALLLTPLAAVEAQTSPAAPVTPGAPPSTSMTPAPATPGPGNPSNPGDFANNPHPGMPWSGITTPYGQFVRWLWMPARAFALDGRAIEQPGFWIAETTSGYYYPEHWALARGPAGERSWHVVPRAFQPR